MVVRGFLFMKCTPAIFGLKEVDMPDWFYVSKPGYREQFLGFHKIAMKGKAFNNNNLTFKDIENMVDEMYLSNGCRIESKNNGVRKKL